VVRLGSIDFDEEPNYFKLQKILKHCYLLARDFKQSDNGKNYEFKLYSVLDDKSGAEEESKSTMDRRHAEINNMSFFSNYKSAEELARAINLAKLESDDEEEKKGAILPKEREHLK
jgi:hypothetical protein